MRFFVFQLTLILFVVMGCKTSQVVQAPVPVTEPVTEYRQLDTLVVTAPKPDRLKEVTEFELPVYHPSYTLRNDLLHTKLELKFNWMEQQVLGTATLKLKPKFYPVNSLTLDAKNFEIHRISLNQDPSPLQYEYDGRQLIIELGRTFERNQNYEITINYTANPAKGDRKGSAAITSDQGLFFINHDGSNANKPQQIWTQGETEFNSRWFPTIDKPNERCTQEMYLTVEEKYKTLSNGVLVSSTKNPDGTRTDYWKMDQPHAPYLFMIAVGDYAVVNDRWEDIPVDYYVEPKYEQDAKAIFSHTPEMLDFFSTQLGIKYPWPKYAQVVVRDYVSGAMENTTAVIYGEFVQKTARELIDDYNNEKIVAHELFHHWFGDLVTCESWANLTMNEGFANYSEYLWLEHKYGRDEADYHLLSELNTYLGTAQQMGVHPLIHFSYEDKESMFDAHSYNKGGLVLHMLRNYVGDEAFWAALNLYLTTHQYTAVEAHDLRLAFEEITGEDLNWFFNQWYFSAGHPELQVQTNFNDQTSTLEVTVEQLQNPDHMPAIFDLPFAIDIYFNADESIRKKVRLQKRKHTFQFQVPERPRLVNVDAERLLLGELYHKKSKEELIFQYLHAPKFLDRYEALESLVGSIDDPNVQKVFKAALDDQFWYLRANAVDFIDLNVHADMVAKITQLAKDDPRSEVRAAALQKLASAGGAQYLDLAKEAIDNDPAYPVVSAGLQILREFDVEEAKKYAKQLETEQFSGLLDAVGDIYAESGDLNTLPFFERSWKKVDGLEALNFISNYLILARNGSEAQLDDALLNLKQMATDSRESLYRRLAATKAIAELTREYQDRVYMTSEVNEKSKLQQKANYLNQLLKEIITQEKDRQLKGIYQQFVQ